MLYFPRENLKFRVGVQRGHSYLMGRRCASLPFVGHPSSDGITIKMPYGVDVLHRPALYPIFPIGLVKTESDFNVRSVKTDLGR